MNNIAKTIKESIDEDKKTAMVFCRDFTYSLRDAGYDIPEPKRVELEHFTKSHLLQSQIKVIDAVIEECEGMKKKKPPYREYPESQDGIIQKLCDDGDRFIFTGYNQALEDQISSLEEVKKSIENL